MDKFEIDSYIKAGEMAKEVKIFVRELVKPGMKLMNCMSTISQNFSAFKL